MNTAEQIQHYAAVRKRLFNPARRGIDDPISFTRPVSRPKPVAIAPVAPKPDVDPWIEVFAKASVDHALPAGEKTPKDMLRDLCAEDGVTLSEIQGPSRKKVLVALRKRYCRHIDAAWRGTAKELSLFQLGRLFGGRDHTTIIHYLGKDRERRMPRRDLPAFIYSRSRCSGFQVQIKIPELSTRATWQCVDLETAIAVRDAGLAAIKAGAEDRLSVLRAGNAAAEKHHHARSLSRAMQAEECGDGV